MSHSTEDQVILAMLEDSLVDDGRVVRPLSDAEPVPVETLERLYAEVLGLLPDELDPVTPRPELKDRILERVRQGDTVHDVEPIPHPRFLAAQAEARASESEDDASEEKSSRGPARPWLLAAILALAMLGGSTFLYLELREEQAATADLRQRVELLTSGRSDVVGALRALSDAVPVAVDVCPLRPTGEDPAQPAAQGSLILVMEQGRWYLRARDLAPPQGSRAYVLWFLDADDQPLHRRVLNLDESREIEIQASGIPRTMEAATITLEPSPTTARPTGPRILYGHRLEMERL